MHCWGCITANIQSAIIFSSIKEVLFGANVPSTVDFVRIRICRALTGHGGCMMSHDHNLLLRSSVFILIGKLVLSVDCLIAWLVQGSLRDMGV